MCTFNEMKEIIYSPNANMLNVNDMRRPETEV